MKKYFVFAFILFGITNFALAGIDVAQTVVEPKGDFILDPAKMEFALLPGETAERTIYITSRVPEETLFSVEVEDFIGSKNPETPLILLGKDSVEKSPYSFRENIIFPEENFSLKLGEKAAVPIKIQVPENAAPGGYYASVIVTNKPQKDKLGNAGARTVSRVGSLLFVRVKGQTKEEGRLEGFRVAGPSDRWLFSKAPSAFELLFANDGNVHLAPRGTITITNIFGRKIEGVKIDPFFTLPNSLRSREILWSGNAVFGRYKATIELERGYDNLSDTKSAVFWVIPWKFIIILFLSVFILVFLFKYILRNFEIKRK